MVVSHLDRLRAPMKSDLILAKNNGQTAIIMGLSEVQWQGIIAAHQSIA